MEEKKRTTWQIVNLETNKKKQVKPVKVVNYGITSMLQIPMYRTEPSYYDAMRTLSAQ